MKYANPGTEEKTSKSQDRGSPPGRAGESSKGRGDQPDLPFNAGDV